MSSQALYLADHECECRRCGTSPCVVVRDLKLFQDTELCGVCFFTDRTMIDVELWNEPKEDTE